MRVSFVQLIFFNVCVTGLVAIIFVVALRDLKNKVNRRFLLFALLVLIYTLSSFLDDFPDSLTTSLWLIRFDLFVANLIPAGFYAFSMAFSGYKYAKKWVAYLIYLPLIPLSIISFLPSTIKDVVRGQYGTNVGNNGPLYYLTLIYFVLVLAYSFVILFKNARESDRITKLQTSLIVFGLGSTVFINLVVVFILPFFKLSDFGNLIGAPSIVILVGSIAYAILTQHMFDIRSVIVRSIGFFVIVGLTAGLFVGGILLSGYFLIPGFVLKTNQYIFILVASVIAGMIFKPTTDFLENKFNKLFARDNYDPQLVLNKVSGLISSTIEVDDLFVGISSIINQYMGVRRVDAVALSGDKIIYRSTDVNSYPTDEEFALLGNENINIDETVDQQKITVLRKYNISFYIVIKAQQEKLGYLLIGPKNNGLSYNGVDIKTFLTIGDQLGIALKNISYYFEVQSFNKTLQEKIESATEELRRANEKLKEADESKDDFISMASHQLTQPISSIEGYLSMANGGYLGELNPKLSDALKAAAGRTKVMKGIIDDLLNVSHMTSGKFSLSLEPNDIAAIIQDEIKQAGQQAKQQGTEIGRATCALPISTIF